MSKEELKALLLEKHPQRRVLNQYVYSAGEHKAVLAFLNSTPETAIIHPVLSPALYAIDTFAPVKSFRNHKK